MLDALPHGLARELSDRRRLNAVSANVDESTLLPAAERYEGTFYTAGRSAIRNLADQGARVLIISGGYGLVLANESIGMYEQVFRPAMWPTRLIERCLAGFAEVNEVRQVIGVLSATTGYSTVFRRTRWPASGRRGSPGKPRVEQPAPWSRLHTLKANGSPRLPATAEFLRRGQARMVCTWRSPSRDQQRSYASSKPLSLLLPTSRRPSHRAASHPTVNSPRTQASTRGGGMRKPGR